MKTILSLLILIPFLATFIYLVVLEKQYTAQMPASVQIQDGRTIPITVNNNKIVYVTSAEKRKLDIARALVKFSLATVFIFAGIRVYTKTRKTVNPKAK
jgi:hypothetical protein